MKKLGLVLAFLFCVTAVWAESSDTTAVQVDSSAVSAQSAQAVKKQVHVPKPKTNWSKIKDLFM